MTHEQHGGELRERAAGLIVVATLTGKVFWEEGRHCWKHGDWEVSSAMPNGPLRLYYSHGGPSCTDILGLFERDAPFAKAVMGSELTRYEASLRAEADRLAVLMASVSTDRLSRVQIDAIHELAAMPNPNNIDELREALNHIYEITKPQP